MAAESAPAPLRHELTVGLRWRDVDVLGHVNQSVYHALLEEARVGLIAELVQRVGVANMHGGLVMRHIELDHHREVRRDAEAVVVSAEVVGVGSSSVRLRQELRLRDGTLAADGIAVLVGWDPQARGKRELSPAEREALGAPAAGTASPAAGA